jgi:hypothetical protein
MPCLPGHFIGTTLNYVEPWAQKVVICLTAPPILPIFRTSNTDTSKLQKTSARFNTFRTLELKTSSRSKTSTGAKVSIISPLPPTLISMQSYEEQLNMDFYEQHAQQGMACTCGLDMHLPMASWGLDLPLVGIPLVDLPIVDFPIVDFPVVDAPLVDIPLMDLPLANIPPAVDLRPTQVSSWDKVELDVVCKAHLDHNHGTRHFAKAVRSMGHEFSVQERELDLYTGQCRDCKTTLTAAGLHPLPCSHVLCHGCLQRQVLTIRDTIVMQEAALNEIILDQSQSPFQGSVFRTTTPGDDRLVNVLGDVGMVLAGLTCCGKHATPWHSVLCLEPRQSLLWLNIVDWLVTEPQNRSFPDAREALGDLRVEMMMLPSGNGMAC